MNLDIKDKKILYELDKNSRIPLSQLSKKVQLNEQTVHYRVKNLIKKGIIKNIIYSFLY